LQGLAAERRVSVPMGMLPGLSGSDLRFEKQGAGTLYYQARLQYAPLRGPTAPVMAGLEVNRRCQGVHDQAGAQGLRVGGWVRCEVEVISPSPRSFVAIELPIAGGFEVADPRMKGAPRWVRQEPSSASTERAFYPDRVVHFVDRLKAKVHRWSYLAKLTTAGDFALPPARAEEMYSPETYGRTASESVHIDP
jgi:uncharacterized protein YfaS (alpha-2-macroglobulin family)